MSMEREVAQGFRPQGIDPLLSSVRCGRRKIGESYRRIADQPWCAALLPQQVNQVA